MRTKPTKNITVVFFVFKTITSFTVRTTPTKSTIVFYVLKPSRLLQCVRHLQKVRLFSVLKQSLLLQCLRHLQKVERLFSLYLKQLLLLQCVRHLQKVRLFSMY